MMLRGSCSGHFELALLEWATLPDCRDRWLQHIGPLYTVSRVEFSLSRRHLSVSEIVFELSLLSILTTPHSQSWWASDRGLRRRWGRRVSNEDSLSRNCCAPQENMKGEEVRTSLQGGELRRHTSFGHSWLGANRPSPRVQLLTLHSTTTAALISTYA